MLYFLSVGELRWASYSEGHGGQQSRLPGRLFQYTRFRVQPHQREADKRCRICFRSLLHSHLTENTMRPKTSRHDPSFSLRTSDPCFAEMYGPEASWSAQPRGAHVGLKPLPPHHPRADALRSRPTRTVESPGVPHPLAELLHQGHGQRRGGLPLPEAVQCLLHQESSRQDMPRPADASRQKALRRAVFLTPHRSSWGTLFCVSSLVCRSPSCEHACSGEGLLHAAGCDRLLGGERHSLQAKIHEKWDCTRRGEVLSVSLCLDCSALSNIQIPLDASSLFAHYLL